MNDNVFIIPKEIKTEVELIKGIYLFDVAVIGGFFMFFGIFEDLVHPVLLALYKVYTIGLGIYFTRQSYENYGKRRFFSYIYKFKKRKTPQSFNREETNLGDLHLTIEDYLEKRKGDLDE